VFSLAAGVFLVTHPWAETSTLKFRQTDPNRAAADGMTLAKMLTQHRAHFARTLRTPPEFAALWDWAEKHGTVH
jgi:hypothetical protein